MGSSNPTELSNRTDSIHRLCRPNGIVTWLYKKSQKLPAKDLKIAKQRMAFWGDENE